VQMGGRVTRVVGLVVESEGPAAHLGDLCRIHSRRDEPPVLAEVVGFRDQSLLLMPLGGLGQIGQGSTVTNTRRALTIPVGPELLGRVLDPLGRPMDALGPVVTRARYPVQRTPPAPLQRPRIEKPLALGIRAIDGLLSVGRGQR